MKFELWLVHLIAIPLLVPSSTPFSNHGLEPDPLSHGVYDPLENSRSILRIFHPIRYIPSIPFHTIQERGRERKENDLSETWIEQV